jgi:hypothetical protein
MLFTRHLNKDCRAFLVLLAAESGGTVLNATLFQADLAKKLGVHVGSVSNSERGVSHAVCKTSERA